MQPAYARKLVEGKLYKKGDRNEPTTGRLIPVDRKDVNGKFRIEETMKQRDEHVANVKNQGVEAVLSVTPWQIALRDAIVFSSSTTYAPKEV